MLRRSYPDESRADRCENPSRMTEIVLRIQPALSVQALSRAEASITVETEMTVEEAAAVAAAHFGCPNSNGYVLTFYGRDMGRTQRLGQIRLQGGLSISDGTRAVLDLRP